MDHLNSTVISCVLKVYNFMIPKQLSQNKLISQLEGIEATEIT